jgi:hypothetical protein
MSADFSKLSNLELKGKTAKFHLPQIATKAFLEVKPTNQSNRGYLNARLKLSSRRSESTSAKSIDLLREDEKSLYAEHAIIGWEGIVDSTNKPVEYTKDEAINLLNALPDWLFDRLRAFCRTEENFLNADEDVLDAESASKN